MDPCFYLAGHEGRARCDVHSSPRTADGHSSVEFAGAQWTLHLEKKSLTPEVERYTFSARIANGTARGVAAGLQWNFSDWHTENHVLIPGAVYAGNRFDALRRPYSPAIREIGQRGDRLQLDIGDIPRLNNGNGRSHLDQTSLDAALPCIAVFFPREHTAMAVLTPQFSSHGPLGYELIESEARDQAELLLLAPGFLHPDTPANRTAHQHPQNARPVDLAVGEEIRFVFECHRFPCADVQGLHQHLFDHRVNVFTEAPSPAPDLLPFSAAWDLLHAKHNEQNWDETHGLYKVGIEWTPDQATQFWQTGWVGGGMTSLAMLQEGDARSQERGRHNLSFLLSDAISGVGLFRATMGQDGVWYGDAQGGGKVKPLSLLRRQGDTVLFALRQFQLLEANGEAISTPWNTAIHTVATALCDLWDREGEFGFLVDFETGQLVIRGSTSGALIPAALALAAQRYDEPRFLRTALDSATHYRCHDLAWGVTSGGPGDAVQAPDGESIFSLIESFITLYDLTQDPVWREASVQACHQAASWVIAYPYRFPENSALHLIGCDARGAMVANAQNKCGVPGICTLSGQGLLRTFRATGDVRLLDLLRDIAHALPPFLSRTDRPIPTRITWAHPFPELPAGWMCERVNITPSWPEPLGEQAAYSCWCEVAMMLTWCDLPGVYAQADTGLIRCLDHVQAEWQDEARQVLRLHNPTAFPARVRVMVETSRHALEHPLDFNHATRLPIVQLEPGEWTSFTQTPNAD